MDNQFKNVVMKSDKQTCVRTSKFDLLFTHCEHCKRRIVIEIPPDRMRPDMVYGTYWTCNICVPENSAARNDIDEPYLTDISKKLFCEE